MLPVMDVSVISLDEDPSLFGGRDASNERRVKNNDLKKVPEFNSKIIANTCLRPHNFTYLDYSCFLVIIYVELSFHSPSNARF